MSSPLEHDSEVVFLIDGSKGVSEKLFKRQKNFVKKLATHFNVSSTGPYGSVATYDTHAYLVAGFVQPDFVKRVDDATAFGRPRRMDRALEQSYLQLSRSGRNGRKMVVLLTAGRDDPASDALPIGEAVKPLRNIGAQTFIIAIGEDHDIRGLEAAADKREDVIQIQLPYRIPLQSQPVARHIKENPCK